MSTSNWAISNIRSRAEAAVIRVTSFLGFSSRCPPSARDVCWFCTRLETALVRLSMERFAFTADAPNETTSSRTNSGVSCVFRPAILAGSPSDKCGSPSKPDGKPRSDWEPWFGSYDNCLRLAEVRQDLFPEQPPVLLRYRYLTTSCYFYLSQITQDTMSICHGLSQIQYR